MGELKSGDVVKLKSGGPEMTIFEMGKKGQSPYCIWFAGEEKKGATFTVKTLQKVDKITE